MLGADTVRFKAEVNFDGREVTKVHISRLDLEKILLVSTTTSYNIIDVIIFLVLVYMYFFVGSKKFYNNS